MKKERDLSIIPIIILIIIIFGVLIGGVIDSTIKDCERMESYGYLTEFALSDGGYIAICYIIMEDGTKVHMNDFNIADYKKPMNKEVN